MQVVGVQEAGRAEALSSTWSLRMQADRGIDIATNSLLEQEKKEPGESQREFLLP